MEWVTTSTIIHDLRDLSNQTAWRSFVGRFQGPMARFLAGLGFTPEDARDIAQESLAAFAEALRGGRYDRDRGRLSSWLFGITYRQALRHRQKTARRARLIADDDPAGPDPIEIASEKPAGDLWNTLWDRFVIQECFRQVRKEFRPASVRAFELIVKEGHDAKEAAEIAGITTRAVYNAKHRILTRMRELRRQLEELE